MSGAKKKLHDMVEALINGDSNAAAASLHDYLQAKTRAILGEEDEAEMVADRSEDADLDDEEAFDDEVDADEDLEDADADLEDADDDEIDAEDEFAFESAGVKKTHMKKLPGDAKDLQRKVKGKYSVDKPTASGSKKSTSGAKPTHMKKNGSDAKDLPGKVKGNVYTNKGTKSDSSGAKKTSIHKIGSDAKDLSGKVKGNVYK